MQKIVLAFPSFLINFAPVQGHLAPTAACRQSFPALPLSSASPLATNPNGGLYQVGSFIGDSWKEWNGRFRDDVRGFFRGEEGLVGRLADRFLGSLEIYGH